MSTYKVRIFIGEHYTEIQHCSEEEVGRWRMAGKIVSRTIQDEDVINQFIANSGFVIKYEKSEEYISPMDVKMVQIMKERDE